MSLSGHSVPVLEPLDAPVIPAVGDVLDLSFGSVKLPVTEFANGICYPDKPKTNYLEWGFCSFGHFLHHVLDGIGFIVMEDVTVISSTT